MLFKLLLLISCTNASVMLLLVFFSRRVATVKHLSPLSYRLSPASRVEKLDTRKLLIVFFINLQLMIC